MDDEWREDGSIRGVKARGKTKGPQFTRVIPKFLQKYHKPPAIQAKFATLPKDDDEEEGLDEVQQAAIDEYLAKEKEEKDTETQEKKSKSQKVVQMGADKPKKKRKRADRPTLSNKKLLSFSMDDE